MLVFVQYSELTQLQYLLNHYQKKKFLKNFLEICSNRAIQLNCFCISNLCLPMFPDFYMLGKYPLLRCSDKVLQQKVVKFWIKLWLDLLDFTCNIQPIIWVLKQCRGEHRSSPVLLFIKHIHASLLPFRQLQGQRWVSPTGEVCSHAPSGDVQAQSVAQLERYRCTARFPWAGGGLPGLRVQAQHPASMPTPCSGGDLVSPCSRALPLHCMNTRAQSSATLTAPVTNSEHLHVLQLIQPGNDNKVMGFMWLVPTGKLSPDFTCNVLNICSKLSRTSSRESRK